MRRLPAIIMLLTSMPVFAAEMKVQRNIAYTDPADAQRRREFFEARRDRPAGSIRQVEAVARTRGSGSSDDVERRILQAL